METKEEIIQAIENIAQKLGIKAELLFSYYLKEAKLYKYRYLLDIVSSLIFFAVSLGFLYYFKSNIDLEGIRFFFFAIPLIASIITGIIFIINIVSFSDLFTAIKNPEYLAIQEILSNFGE